MANLKSAKKRVRVNEKKTLRNRAVKTRVKSAIKSVEVAVAAGDKDLAQANLTDAVTQISKGVSKGVYHKNTAARRVSRLTKAVNTME